MIKITTLFITLLFYVLPFQVPTAVDGDQDIPNPLPVKDGKKGQLYQMIEMGEQALGSKKTFYQGKELVAQAFKFAKENNLEIPYQLLWLQAEVALSDGNIYLAEAAMEKTWKHLMKIDDEKEKIKARSLWAKIMKRGGEFSKAIEMFQKNMKLAKENEMIDIFLESAFQLAEISWLVDDVKDSKKYYRILFTEAAQAKDTFWITQSLFRLGGIALAADSNFPQAARYQLKCLHIARLAYDTNRIAWTMNHLAWNLYLMKEYDSALATYNEVVKLGIIAKMPGMVTNSLGNIGTIYRDMKEYAEAEKYYSKSIQSALESSNLENLQWIHHDISDMYVTLGDYQKAYKHYVRYKLYNDSISNLKFERGLDEARMKYDVDQQKKELEVLTLQLDKQRYFTYGFAILIILIIVVGLLVIRQFRSAAKRRISEMNHRLSEITQANLRQQMNPHFIFNTLNSIQYYMYQHDKVATNNYLTKFSSLIRKILENSQHTSIPIKDEVEALQLYLELEKLRFKDKFSYEIDVDEEIDILQYKIPTMLIQPYVENAICHGLVNKEDSGYVNIALSLEYDYISCIIEDNGIGREAAIEIRKNKEFNHNSLGTRITQSRLDLVNSLYGTSLKVIYNDLKDETGKAVGTRVENPYPYHGMSEMIKTLIVDDEPDAVNFISSIAKEYCPKLEIVGTANSVKEAVKVITERQPDLVFLDVEMPHGSGFDLLIQYPEKNFDVIFITAFNHYAIQAIKFSAVDYILKPININEFIQAVDKVFEKRLKTVDRDARYNVLLENIRSTPPTRLAIPTSDGMEFLNTREIVRIEADRSYCWFYLTDKRKILVSRNLKEFQELLTSRNFFRPHNSHLINLEHVKKYVRHDGNSAIMDDGSQIPISRNNRDLFLAMMTKLSR